MRTRFLLFLIAVVASGAAQNNDKFAGFTKSPSEHIINQLDKPFEVRSVRGVVTREGGDQESLKSALVEIKGPGDQGEIRHTTTDENGKFKFRRVPAGTYEFKITLNGFQSVVGTIVVSNKAPKRSSIQIAMIVGV